MIRASRMAAIAIGASALVALTALGALAQPGGTQVAGEVVSVSDTAVELADGSSLRITEQTRVTQIWPATAADLVPGHYVAISAARGVDGSLIASLIGVFPEGVRPGEGQREMSEVLFCAPGCAPRDLMTNANVDEAVVDAVTGGQLTVSFLGQTTRVHLLPSTRVELQRPGTLADITPGAQVLGFVNAEGVTPTLWVYME